MKKYILSVLAAGFFVGAGYAQENAAKSLRPESGIMVGPISALDTVKGEITIGRHTVTVAPKELEGLKVGDDVRVKIAGGKVSVAKVKLARNKNGSTVVKKMDTPRPCSAKSGVILGPIAAINAVKGEITIGDRIVTADPKELEGLKTGDNVRVKVTHGSVSVVKTGTGKSLE